MMGEIVSENHLGLVLLLQGTTCLGLGLAGSYLWRRRAARAHQILLVGLLASVVMPALYVSVQHFELGLLTTRAPAPSEPLEFVAPGPLSNIDPPIPVAGVVEYEPLAVEATAPAVPVSAPVEETTAVRIPWSTVLRVAWIAASVLLLSRLLLRFGLGLRLLAKTEPVEAPLLLETLESVRARFGLNVALEIRRSTDVRSPVIWCWRKPPVLLVQQDIARAAETNDLAGVFCHELAHWKRLDHLSGLLAELMVCIMPWHPLLWWAKSRLLKLSEEVCDDWVLASGQAGVDYAESLLDLSPQREMAFVPTVLGKEKAMKERIQRIVSEECGDPRIGTRWMGTVCVLVLVGMVGVAFAQHRPAEHDQHGQTEHQEFREQHEHNEEQHELAVAGRRNVLERMLDQLVDQVRETEAALDAQGDEPGARGHVLRSELDALRDHIGIIERQLGSLQKARRTDARRKRAEHTEKLAMHFVELRRHRGELAAQARPLEQELEALGEEQSEKRERLSTELREIHEHMEPMEQELADLELYLPDEARQRVPELELTERLQLDREFVTQVKRRLEYMEDPDSRTGRVLKDQVNQLHARIADEEKILEALRNERHKQENETHEEDLKDRRAHAEQLHDTEAHARELARHQEELGEKMRLMERELEALGDRPSEKREQIIVELREIHEHMKSLDREHAHLDQQRAAGAHEHTQKLAEHLHELQAHGTEVKHRLERMDDPDSDKARELRAHLDNLHEEMIHVEEQLEDSQHQRRESLEGETRRLGDAPRERPGIEVEVEELRGKINGMHEEMTQMRKLLEQLLERSQKRVETEEVEEFHTIR